MYLVKLVQLYVVDAVMEVVGVAALVCVAGVL